MFRDWLKISAKLSTYGYSLKNCVCPECGLKGLDFVYVGDPTTQIGYLPIWCNSCNKGIRISRVEIPECVGMISFGDWKTLESRVPNFEEVF